MPKEDKKQKEELTTIEITVKEQAIVLKALGFYRVELSKLNKKAIALSVGADTRDGLLQEGLQIKDLESKFL